MLFLGVGAVMFTATLFVGGWVLYDQFFRNDTKDATESEVPVFAYHHESEILQEPQAGVKYLVEDDAGIDADLTLTAVMDWVKADDPNIWTGDWKVTVNTYNDAGLVQIHGDASTMLKETYDNVQVPYFTGDGFLETVSVDLDFT
jgi:hypothetical protein